MWQRRGLHSCRLTTRFGIKICAEGGELFTTHYDVVRAIVEGLVAAGHVATALSSGIVRSREQRKLVIKQNADAYQLRAIAPRDGYDAKAIFSAPMIGKLIWGDLEYKTDNGKMPMLSDDENTSSMSHFARILSNDVRKSSTCR